MKEFIQRLKLKSPAFFVKLKKFAIGLGVSLIAVWTINKQMELGLPGWMIDVCRYGIAICAGIAGTSQLTVKDTEKIKI